jgi:hypothetical protein
VVPNVLRLRLQFSEFESVLFEFHYRHAMQFAVKICDVDNSAPPGLRIIEFICLFLLGHLPEHESIVLFCNELCLFLSCLRRF